MPQKNVYFEGSILGGVFLGVSLFIVYQQKYVSPGGGSDDGDAIIGMILLLVSGLIGGIAIVKTNHVLSDHSFDDISKYDRYFWMFLFQIPVYAVSIASDLLLGKSIAFTDFIPFYGYDYKAFLLILFLVVQYFTGTVVQGIGAQGIFHFLQAKKTSKNMNFSTSHSRWIDTFYLVYQRCQ